MRSKRHSLTARVALGMCTMVLLAGSASAATETVIHPFNPGGWDGSGSQANMISDAQGNLYGTTFYGGRNGVGTVFELSPNGNGGWTEKVLHDFRFDGEDGNGPSASLIMDAAGNLYGTTTGGGTRYFGTVFELSPNANGGWTEKKLHNFGTDGNDGIYPTCSLVFDAGGNLYGTTSQGGDNGGGTVFELAPNGRGGWTERKLHNFPSVGSGGYRPIGGLVVDSAGNLYGTTSQGGDYLYGTAFQLIPNGNGSWTEKKLHNFGNGSDGNGPSANLIFDASGNLFGTTTYGGDYSLGTAFELMPNGSGGWTEKKLHNFGDGADGTLPVSSLALDTAGHLYGTTSGNPQGLGPGTAFQLTSNGSGGWTEKILRRFSSGEDPNGSGLLAGLTLDAAGNLYGTTASGGDYGCGVVFELSPNGSGPWTEKKLHNFHAYGIDGLNPANQNLVSDNAGNLYGATGYGGLLNAGVVFELMPDGNGGWTEKVIYNFTGLHGDGAFPLGTLVFDAAGNLYGTTNGGGNGLVPAGTVFELIPNGSGGWSEKILHNFNTDGDGVNPNAGLVIDRAGNLYGTTSQGGVWDAGTAFEMTPDGNGGWTEKKLHNFGNGSDGIQPIAALVFDGSGNLYGTTAYGGDYYHGTVFELSPNGNGGWTEKKLHNFGAGRDGVTPYASLIFDAAGNLYGTTQGGGVNNSGVVFQLTLNGDGGWTEKVLHYFNIEGPGLDGGGPEGSLRMDAAGSLYGTTFFGGDYGWGTIFKLTPDGSGGWNETKLHNFANGSDGATPESGLIFDPAGNLYGTTDSGGHYGVGTVYRVTP